MAHDRLLRFCVLTVLVLAGACATERSPAPIPEAQVLPNMPADAELMAVEYHGARIGPDHLRGHLSSN